MTIICHQFLGILCFIFAVIVLNPRATGTIAESSVCDDESIFHFDSGTCLKVFTEDAYRINNNFCGRFEGGENVNISGHVLRSTEDIDDFVRDYLRFLGIPRAFVNNSYVSRQERNTLQRCRDRYFKYRFRDLDELAIISLAEVLGKPILWEMNTFDSNRESAIVCQVSSGEPVSEQSICPLTANLVSVSETQVQLYLEPGDVRSQLTIRFSSLQKCENESSSLCTSQITNKVFLVKPMNHTTDGLKSNTDYTVQFGVQRQNNLSFECNTTIQFTTDKAKLEYSLEATLRKDLEYKSAVSISLSVVLTISLCITIVVSVLYYRLLKQTRKDKSSQEPVESKTTPEKDKCINELTKVFFSAKPTAKDRSASDVKITKTAKTADKDKTLNQKNASEAGNYTNLYEPTNSYEQPTEELDNHVYEAV